MKLKEAIYYLLEHLHDDVFLWLTGGVFAILLLISSVLRLVRGQRDRLYTFVVPVLAGTCLLAFALAVASQFPAFKSYDVLPAAVYLGKTLPVVLAFALPLAVVALLHWLDASTITTAAGVLLLAFVLYLTFSAGEAHKVGEHHARFSMLEKKHQLIRRADLPPDTETQKWNGVDMVFVSAGPFLQGSLDRAQRNKIVGSPLGDEYPMMTRELPAYWIDMYEVTIGQFAAFVADTGHVTLTEKINAGRRWTPEDSWILEEGLSWRNPMHPEDDGLSRKDHPVTQVTWHDAYAFCAWREARLPTAAEWEKAARGHDGRRFPWGNRFDPEKANSCGSMCYKHGLEQEAEGDDGYEFTAPVGSFPQGISPYGAYDMAGNVWEFVSDYYDPFYYYYSPIYAPKGPARGTHKIVKGGSFLSASSYLRTASKSFDPLDEAYFGVGFRCAKDLERTD